MRREFHAQHSEPSFYRLDELVKTPEELQKLKVRFITAFNEGRGDEFITRWLQELLAYSGAEGKANLLSAIFEMKRPEELHPLTENFMTAMSNPYEAGRRMCYRRNPAEGLVILRDGKRENPQQAKNSVGFYLDYSMVRNGRNEIIQKIAESLPLLDTTRKPEGVRGLLERWVSQALIIADEGHPVRYSYGDRKLAATWLHLMMHSPDFYNTMMLLLECYYLLGSPNVPPVQLFSKGSRLIDYEKLIRMLDSDKGQEAIGANLKDGFAALLSAVTADQTTGFGRDSLLADLIATAYHKLGNGGQFKPDTLRILNLGSSIVQPTEIARHLREKGVPLGPALNIDRLPPRELAAHTTAHIFSVDNVQSAELQGDALRVVSAMRQPIEYTGDFKAADLRFPLPDEVITAISTQEPNCIIAAQSLVPHLHHLERVGVLQQIFEIMKPGSKVIVALTGGYIGTPDVVTGVFAVCTKGENGMIATVPYAVSIANGWATEGRSELYDTTNLACTAQSVPVHRENKPAYHVERLGADTSYSKRLIAGKPNAADLRQLRNRTPPPRNPRVNVTGLEWKTEGFTWEEFAVAYARLPHELLKGYLKYLWDKKIPITDSDKEKLGALVKILSGESTEASVEIALAWQDFCEDTFNQATMHTRKVRELLERHLGDLVGEPDLKLLESMISVKIKSAPQHLVFNLTCARKWYDEYEQLLQQIKNQAESVYGPLSDQGLSFVI